MKKGISVGGHVMIEMHNIFPCPDPKIFRVRVRIIFFFRIPISFFLSTKNFRKVIDNLFVLAFDDKRKKNMLLLKIISRVHPRDRVCFFRWSGWISNPFYFVNWVNPDQILGLKNGAIKNQIDHPPCNH